MIEEIKACIAFAVGDARATLYQWGALADRTRRIYGWPLAFAAQDGMTPEDVPEDADVVFLGGSDDFKRDAIIPWCARFPRVHVGRVNTYKWVRYCADAGAESCDGTGWFRGGQERHAGLVQFLREQAGEIQRERQKKDILMTEEVCPCCGGINLRGPTSDYWGVICEDCGHELKKYENETEEEE